MQDGRAVRVDDALGVAGRAARVAHGRGRLLVTVGERGGIRVGDQLLVVHDAVVLGQLAGAVVHHDDVLHGGEVLQVRSEQLHQRPVGEDHLVAGVVDDVAQLVGEQADVQRVQHTAGARRGEVELEVAGRVPRERGHAAVVGDPERVERAGKPAGALRPVRIRPPLQPLRRRRHDPLVAVDPLRTVEHVRQGQRE
jgi:hypothetical protein